MKSYKNGHNGNGAKATPKHQLLYSESAEAGLVGSVLVNTDILAYIDITPGEFFIAKYRAIFETVIEMAEAGMSCDFITIESELARRGYEYTADEVMRITLDTPTSIHAAEYAGIIRRLSQLRALFQAGADLVAGASNPEAEPDIIAASAEAAIRSGTANGKQQVVRLFDALSDFQGRIERIIDRGNAIMGIPTGLTDIDRITGGLYRSDLILVAGRPGMGKTAFATQIGIHAAEQGARVLVFSLEMSSEQLTMRIVAGRAGISVQDIRLGRVQLSLPAITQATSALAELPLDIDDRGALTIGQIRRAALRQWARHGVDLIIVDYIQIARGDGANRGDKRLEVGEISGGLKALAKELDIPVVGLSQLSRSLESRRDKRPMLSDLMESGSLEADADVVIFLYRDEYYTKDASDAPNTAEAIIAKHRNGPTGTAQLYFNGKQTKFDDLAITNTKMEWGK